EKELYEILIRRYNQKLYRAIRSYLINEADIEDSMQNSYINAYTHLQQFRHDASFSTWLIRIGINEALAKLKEKKKFLTHVDTSYPDTVKTVDITDYKQLNPQEQMIRQESKYLLETAIDSLQSKYKIVYILKELEEMSLQEIADTLKLTVSNVKVRLHRSKEMLKSKLLENSNTNNVFEFGNSRCDRLTAAVMHKI
ncbi:MAG: sigma-70 family RNA polymerase sigma factor, partial [Chitinophagaceae bacterium]|nr:sigma-70 family RNA polymerase sigma factor [Chitinophagaceae bacterium]